MVAGVGIEPTTRGFSVRFETHKQLFFKRFAYSSTVK